MEVLLLIMESTVVPLIFALFIIDQDIPTTRPVIVTVPVAPFAIFPALSVNMFPLNDHAEAYNHVNHAGRVSVTTVQLAVSGPRLL